MFNDDKNSNKEINPFLQVQREQRWSENSFGNKTGKSKRFIAVIFFIVITILVALLFFLYELKKSYYNRSDLVTLVSVVKDSNLPVEIKDETASSSDRLLLDENSNEKLVFGAFYKKQDFFYDNQKDFSYNLPINIKADTVNYYDLSRKINFNQEIINGLNEDAFVITKSSLIDSKNNFWSVYQKLVDLNVPIMITNDFLSYYFQNNIKSIYKEIEQSVFYDNLWDVNMAMYNIALARYRDLSSLDDNENNPLLESVRMELTFFATGLKLLEPKKNQISDTKLIDENKFNPQELERYTFNIPDYLKNSTIEKELALIMSANSEQKSPIFLYERDYRKFIVPGAYKNNAKLNNFFLATEWMRSEFPLYQQSSNCSDCLLDFDDWRINFGAACFIADDLYSDLELKNKWAVIYKYISFFSGLRQDLTFLNYNKALVDLFGADYDLEKIFSSDNSEIINDLAKIQNQLTNYSFSEIEGTYPRSDKYSKYLGMRLLQDYFWPNNYIFDYLSGPDLRTALNGNNESITSCKFGKSQTYRCSSFGLDIVNLLKPIDNSYYYFTANSSVYQNYQTRLNSISDQISRFDKNAWNNNIYWMTLDLLKPLLSESNKTAYTKNSSWDILKNYNTVLGAWVDIHLSGEKFLNTSNVNVINTGNSLGGAVCNKYNTIETDIEFINELISKGEMLLDMTTALNIDKNTNVVSVRLKKLNEEMRAFRDIAKREIEGIALSDDDCYYIKSFVKNYTINSDSNNFFTINQKETSIKESVDGVKLLFVVNRNNDGKKVINAGPIFNYQEGRASR